MVPGIIAYHLYKDTGIGADLAYGKLVFDVLPAPLTGVFAAGHGGRDSEPLMRVSIALLPYLASVFTSTLLTLKGRSNRWSVRQRSL